MQIKNNKRGSAAVYAFLSISFFIVILLSVFLLINARYKARLQSSEDIQLKVNEEIQKNKLRIESNPSLIYIYNLEQLELAGNGEYVYIPEDDIMYKFLNNTEYILIPNELNEKTDAVYNNKITSKKNMYPNITITMKDKAP